MDMTNPLVTEHVQRHAPIIGSISAEDEAKVLMAMRELRGDKATGTIEIRFMDGGVCALVATKSKKLK